MRAFSIFITFFLGLFAARWMMTLKNKVIQLIFDGIFTLPLVLPPTVMGFFLLLIFGVNQPIGSFFLNVFGVRIAFSFSATVIAKQSSSLFPSCIALPEELLNRWIQI